MAVMQRVGEGLRLIRETFVFLWQYKFLVIYPAIAMVAFAVVQLLLSAAFGIWTFNFLPDQRLVARLIESSNYPVIALLFFIQGFLVTFFAVRLANHTIRLVHRQKTPLMQELTTFLPKILLIVIWSVILVLVTIAQYGIAVRYQTMVHTMPIQAWAFNSLQIVLLAWILFTCYVIPIIALENLSIIGAIKLSMRLVKKTWLEIITGFGVLLLITSIFIAPAVLWFSSLSLGTILINALLVWPVQCIGSTLSTMFTAIAYHHFYKQPMEDVEMMRYPEF